MQKTKSRLYQFVIALVFVLAFSAVYLYAFPAPTIFYAGMVLLHTGAGVAAALCLARFLWRFMRQFSVAAKAGWLLFTISAALGIALIFTGTTRAELK